MTLSKSMTSDNIFVSVIICTHRRPDSLELALESLVREDWKGSDWEVLVIENDLQPSPEVAEVLARFESSLPIRACLEAVPNLSRARNLGAKEAQGEYLAYLDDDVEVVRGWLGSLVAGCREFHPDICGGPSYPLYRMPKSYWYKDDWATAYYYGDKPMVTDKAFGGMNFIVRKELVVAIGGFREALGMSGDKIAYGEEVDLLIRARKAFADLVTMYFPDVAVRHEVRPVKMTIWWCIESTWACARDCLTAGVNSESYDSWPQIVKQGVRSSLRLMCKLPVLLLVALSDLFRPGRGLWRRYVKEHLLSDMSSLFSTIHATAFRLTRRKNSQ